MYFVKPVSRMLPLLNIASKTKEEFPRRIQEKIALQRNRLPNKGSVSSQEIQKST